MACDTFQNCIGDNPLPNIAISTQFSTLPEILYFVLNLIFWVLYLGLFVLMLVNLVNAIYKLAFEPKDSPVTFQHMNFAFKRAATFAVGLVLLTGANYFIVVFLQLLGAESDILALFGPAGLILGN